jgi:hypothetical protein
MHNINEVFRLLVILEYLIEAYCSRLVSFSLPLTVQLQQNLQHCTNVRQQNGCLPVLR